MSINGQFNQIIATIPRVEIHALSRSESLRISTFLFKQGPNLLRIHQISQLFALYKTVCDKTVRIKGAKRR